MRLGCVKLTGFETLLERTGISQKVLVFGDGENDVETQVSSALGEWQMQFRGQTVAKHHVGASADDGVAHALLELNFAQQKSRGDSSFYDGELA